MSNMDRIQRAGLTLVEGLNEPRRTTNFLGSDEWKAMCEKFVEERWDHLVAALNAKSFDEKEYHRGFIEGLQHAMELPVALFKEDKEDAT